MVGRYPSLKNNWFGRCKRTEVTTAELFNYAVTRAARTKIEVLVDLVRDLPYDNVLPYKIIYLVRNK